MSTVFIQIDKPFYIAGDTVNGYVFLNVLENLNANQVLVKFKGWESVRWYEERILSEQEKQTIAPHLIYQNTYRIRMDSSDSEDHPGQDECARYRYVTNGVVVKEIVKYQGHRHIARFDSLLYNFGGSFIPSGQYSFPFSFKTGQNYPASFLDKSSKNDRRGRIKYEMQAFVRGFNNKIRLIRTKQQIVIREMAPIKNDQQQMEAHVTSCCCIDQGTTRIQCYFQKNGYMPGEDARIYCILDNTEGQSQVTSVDVTLLNEITYTSSEGYKKTFRENIFKKNFSGLQAGQKGERENVVKILNTNNSSLGDIKPTARGNRLHSIYFLVVQASLAAACTCCSDLPIVRQPVLIYPFIPINNVFNAPPNWQPDVMPVVHLQVGLPSLGINSNPFNSNSSNPMNSNNTNNANIYVNMQMPTMNMNVNMQGGIEMSSEFNSNQYNNGMQISINAPTQVHYSQGNTNVRMF